MSINLATKYSPKIAEKFSSCALIADKGADGYEFTGVKSLKVYTPITVELTNYTRSGANRYGDPTEMQDTTQELAMTQDKSFSLTIDKGNNEEQMMIKSAGRMLSLQIAERVVPEVDKYSLFQIMCNAGKSVAISAEPTSDNILKTISTGVEYMDDSMVAPSDRYIAVTSKIYSAIRLSPEYIGLESLGTEALKNGVIGEIFGLKIIKIPSGYMPTGFLFVIFHKDSVIFPNKLKDAKLHEDAPGISGALIEGRWIYDAFVLGARSNGVYSCVLNTVKQATPTIDVASSTITMISLNSSLIKYTLDGTDPRYSSTAMVYTSGIANNSLPTGKKLFKVVAYRNKYAASDVKEQEVS